VKSRGVGGYEPKPQPDERDGRAITSTQRQAIQIEYKFNAKWSVSATRNQNGGFGVDGRYRKDF
jgi:hypothetical protein